MISGSKDSSIPTLITEAYSLPFSQGDSAPDVSLHCWGSTSAVL